MKRALVVISCLLLALVAAAPAEAKKKKRKPINLGPVVAVTSTSAAIGSTQEGSATASCPAGLQAVGGGFSSPLSAGVAVVVTSSYMSSPTGWTVAGSNESGVGAITATVYCRNTSRAPVTDVASALAVPVIGSVGTVTPTCPSASRLVGGGFQTTTSPGTELFAMTNLSSSPSTWTVSALNLDSSAPLTVTGHAYCMKGIRPPATLSASGSTPAVQYTTLDATTPTCPIAKKPKKAKKKKGKKKRKKKPAQLLSAGGFSIQPGTLANPPQGIMGISQIGTTGGFSGQVTNATNGVGTLSLTVQGLCV